MRSRGSEKVCFTCLPPPCRALAPSSFGICVDRIRTGRAWPAGCAERLSTMRFRKLRMSIVRALCRDREWVWVLPEHCFRFLETSANCERFWLCVSLPCRDSARKRGGAERYLTFVGQRLRTAGGSPKSIRFDRDNMALMRAKPACQPGDRHFFSIIFAFWTVKRDTSPHATRQGKKERERKKKQIVGLVL